MNKKSVITYLLILLFTILSSYLVYAQSAGAPTVEILLPADGVNLTTANGTTTAIVLTVNVSAVNTTSNITNITIYLKNSANATIDMIGLNITHSTGNTTYNFTILNANLSGRTNGIRNYSIDAKAYTTTTNQGLGNLTGNDTQINITIDNTAPTVTINNGNATNQTTASFTLNITVSDNLFNNDLLNLTYNFTCTAYSGIDKITQTNATFRISNATVFPANATMTQKLHKINATCTDSVGINGSSSLLDLTVDTTQPRNANMTFSATKINFGKTVVLTCFGSDDTSNASNATLYIEPAGLSGFRRLINSTTNNVTFTFGESQETRALGIYSANCSIVDYSGLQNSTTLTFEVVRAPSEQNTPPSVIKAAKERVASIIISSGTAAKLGDLTTEGFSRLMAKGGKAIFIIAEEEHSLEVKEVSADQVTLTISSTPMDVTIDKGETTSVDVSNDGYNDIEIIFHGVDSKKRADITFKGIPQPGEEGAQPVEKEEPEQAPAEGAGSATLIIILVIVVVVIVGYFIVRRKQ